MWQHKTQHFSCFFRDIQHFPSNQITLFYLLIYNSLCLVGQFSPSPEFQKEGGDVLVFPPFVAYLVYKCWCLLFCNSAEAKLSFRRHWDSGSPNNLPYARGLSFLFSVSPQKIPDVLELLLLYQQFK